MKHDRPLPEAPPAVRARLYAALHAGTPGDVEFYVRACHGARTILEYGCGAGRIALELAERGHTVLGVDLDPALLALAQQRKAQRELELGHALPVSFVLGDMTTFGKRGRDRVIVPYSALWCLNGTEAKRQCLTMARKSLRRDGQLVFDVYDADVLADGDYSEPNARELAAPKVERDAYEELHRIELDGITYRVWEQNSWTRATRSMQVDYRLLPAPSSRSKSGTSPRAPRSKAAPRRGLASRRSLASVTVSPSRSPTPSNALPSVEIPSEVTPSGYQLTLRHSVLWRHELAELLDDCGYDVEWGVDEAGEATPFAEQLVVRAVRT